MMKTIEICNGVTKKTEWAMAEPVNFSMEQDEHIAIVGRNGAGKTLLVDMLTGRHPLFPGMATYDFTGSPHELIADNIRYITFRDVYGGDNDRTYFLQQRWNQMEIDESTPTVKEKLEESYRLAGADTPDRRSLQRHIYEIFQMEHLLDKYIILLSSGELRKFKLASSLFSNPRLLIMDNPFIGLDEQTREQLTILLNRLSQEQKLQIILVLSKSGEIPTFITHVVEVKDMKVQPKVTRDDYLHHREAFPVRVLSEEKGNALKELKKNDHPNSIPTPEVICFNKVSIRYGERTILRDLDWQVMQGEHWALSGQNGSGKSTLLSLVCADNPQSYACDIRLFGHQRGAGESIWQIKKRIGYVSPEMHRSYQRDIPAWRIVASGLMDTVGLYERPTEEQKQTCRWWMNIFGIVHLAERSFLQVSSGEQRLILLARAFVKDPELLILDEPLHGLDNWNRRLVKDVIEAFCSRRDKTLIFVTHYKEEFPQCIDHSLALRKN